jgi:predicted site-specific integrase-resolvase
MGEVLMSNRTETKKRMAAVHLTPKQLAERWGISWHTLAHFRMDGSGPKFIKIGKHVLYPLHEVEAYEAKKTKRSTLE